jgi:hypothetical protein
MARSDSCGPALPFKCRRPQPRDSIDLILKRGFLSEDRKQILGKTTELFFS